ncbi:MAG: adenylyl-sulfate kinase, partial [Gemmatimonadaceae bacterium]|nr:adenylyl-sulfate kinase [Acetobacteraceae bacterium]
ADRRENVRRAAVVARLLADAGQVVLVALISPQAADRALARQVVGDGFREVFVQADLATCEARDPKGLYAAARAGHLQGFTGVDAPYDVPDAPDLRVPTGAVPVGASAKVLADFVVAAVALPGLAPRPTGSG